MDLTIIIVSWNVRDLLRACLRSVFDDLAQSGIHAAVWVVDNASADGSPEMVAAEFPVVELIASQENVGFAAGNNLALRELGVRNCELGIRNSKLGIRNCEEPGSQHLTPNSQLATHNSQFATPNSQFAIRNSPFVWLLNPDTEVRPGATAALLAALEANPSVAIAGAKLRYGDGSFQHGAFRFPGLTQLLFELFPCPPRLYETRLNGRYARHLYAGPTPFPIDHPLGASMMVRATAIAAVGPLDESYHMYCEEIDWCWRMRRAGWKAVCAPAAEVIHYAGQSTTQVPISSFVNLWTSRARLYARIHGPLSWALAKRILRAGMRRRMRDASPEMAVACRQVIDVWEAAR
ncbi:MAG: glycosyltransferase family 2 protein [Anaerolineae bacterium]|nr:glycosyltransferase family 2 protein [Anaerolineae bacterium]